MPTNTEPGPGPNLQGVGGVHGHQGSSSRNDASSTSVRRVLGEVSPNIRASAVPSASHLSKPMAGSPLKRSFTAAMEGNGFKYFKKRKRSSETPLSQQYSSYEKENLSRSNASVGHAHPNPAPSTQVPVPQIETSYPTEPNTPTSEDGNDNGIENSSAERRSFSSLINYDPSSQPLPPNASQQQQQQESSKSGLVFHGPSRTELLRLRLKVAMFKVRTNQIAVPFEKLEPEAKLSTSVAVEGAVALLRDQAREKTAARAPPPPPNVMLAAPVLKPTGYSSRMVFGPAAIPSSPPAAAAASRGFGEVETPGRRYVQQDEAELTSSIVKGRVAEGLLGLRHGF